MMITRTLLWTLLLLCSLTACRKGEEHAAGTGRLQVAVTLFPLYDFAREVGGDRVEVRMLIPPGVEPHNFEPRPEDLLRLAKADIFIFSNRFMEPWATGILKGVDNRGLMVVDAGAGITLNPVAETDGHEEHGDESGHHHEGGMDPHIWMSVPNAERMVENVRDGLIRKDPAGADAYRKNAAAYLARLKQLDLRFRKGLSDCRTRTFLHGGHYAFGYLTKEYGLSYLAAYAVTADSEPTPKKMMALVDLMKKNSLHTIFYEELLSPRVAETIARETGASLLKLHGIHNVTRDDLAAGATYISLMEANLGNLRTGLSCR
jgi:zinc transport system substrate-binding protein